MTDHDEPQHRAYHQADPEDFTLREETEEDGTFAVRMPLASTGDVRNEGDDALSTDEIEGMSRQIEERSVGVFIDHGANTLGGSRYSAIGKVGEWRNPEMDTRDGTDVLEADAVMMDPETLPSATGGVREALAAIREQVKRDMTLSSSIGWRDDESFPGGVDLMEASIVGIPADPRTTSQDAPMAAMARAAVNAGADPEAFVAEVRAAVMGPDSQAQDMTEDTDPEDEQSTDSDRDESDGMDEQEYREFMREQQEQQTEILRTVAEAIREDDDDEDDDDDDDDDDGEENEGDHDEDEDDDENSQSLDVDGEEVTVDDIREMREQLDDADAASPDGDDEDDEARDADESAPEPLDLLKED